MTTDPTHVFLDANIVLHFKRADQIDWCGLAGASELTLVIAPIFLRELEKQKVHNPSRKLRDRAADAVKWFAGLIDVDDPILRSGVRLQFLPHVALLDFAALRLSESLSDDHLIASALEFRDADGGTVLVATADVGVRVKLRAHNLRALIIPDDCRLPAELDAAEKELRDLRKEVARLRSRQPKLILHFEGGEQRLILPRRSRSSNELEDKLARVKSDHPHIPHANEKPMISLSAFDVASTLGSFGMKPAAIDHYNEQLDQFYREYRTYLERVQALRDRAMLTYELTFALENNGAAPATDIDAILTFPDDVGLTDVDDLPKAPEPPRPPLRPYYHGALFDAYEFSPAHAVALPSFYRGPYNPNGKPRIDRSGYRVRFPQNTVKHGFLVTFAPLYLIFPEPARVRSLTIEVEISAAELPDPVSHNLHIIVDDECSA
jgi:PIN domain